LVLATTRFAEIQAVIPGTVVFDHGGQQLTAVEHSVEASQVLRNMGFRDVPLPITQYYSWPGRFMPRKHQLDTASFLTANHRALCLNGPGTGKTVASLWAADYLMSEGLVKKVLIIAPLSTVKIVWGSELVQHFPHRRFEVLTQAKARRMSILEESDAEFFIINHDGFSTMPNHFADMDLVIYDEATALKNPSTERYKKFYKFMADNRPWLWMLTGTPISQSPEDAWTLSKLVGSTTVPRSFNAFRNMVMQKVTNFKWVARPDALDVCKGVMQPSIRYSLSECTDLPETVFIDRMCELTKPQAAAFSDMQQQAMVMGTNISAANAAVVFQKLLQICCGVVYAEDGEHVQFDDSGRTEALLQLLSEIGGKCIVFVPLRGVQTRVVEVLESAGFDVAAVHGDVPKKKRDNIFYDFQNTSKIDILVAHPRVAAHGLTLTTAKSIIWYAPIHSLEQYEQANARIRRIGTTGKTAVYNLSASGFETELYRRLRTKQKTLADFLQLVSGVNEQN
jgi:SNF2 family DNA or RNA helicase